MTWTESEGEEWKGEQPNGWEYIQSSGAAKDLGMFILDENQSPILADNVLQWGEWMETADRHVGSDIVGRYRVSTVFLGLDHRFSTRGWPVLFETMVFRLDEEGDRDVVVHEGDDIDSMMERYRTWSEAEAGHKRMIEYVQQALSPKPT